MAAESAVWDSGMGVAAGADCPMAMGYFGGQYTAIAYICIK